MFCDAAPVWTRIAISPIRKHGNDAKSVSLLRACFKAWVAATEIVIVDGEPVGQAGLRFAYVASQGRVARDIGKT
jgi:hypothetical protein